MTDTDSYVLKMKEKLVTSILDFLILYLLAFDSMEDISPYSIRKILSDRWEWFNPPLPTIYSRIERLEKSEIIDSTMVLVGARGKKILKINDNGWRVLKSMIEEMGDILQFFEVYDDELQLTRFKLRRIDE